MMDIDDTEMTEEVRKRMKRKPTLETMLKVNPSFKIARHVDQEAINKCVLSQYGKNKTKWRKYEGNDKVHKAQAMVGSGYTPADIPIGRSLEEEFFNKFGSGLSGEKTATPLHQAFFCRKCGLKMHMDTAIMPMNCPRCGHSTPLGDWVKQGYHRR